MELIKEVLQFLNQRLGMWLRYIAWNFVFSLLGVMVLLAAFFVMVRFRPIETTLILVMLVIFISQLAGRFLLSQPKLFAWQVVYASFLEQDSSVCQSISWQQFRERKKELSREWSKQCRWFAGPTFLFVLFIKTCFKTIGNDEWVFWKSVYGRWLKIVVLKLVLAVVISIPFAGIAIFTAWQFPLAVKLLLLMMGLHFALFICSAFIFPVLSLLLQRIAR
jgi:hypothetical protein